MDPSLTSATSPLWPIPAQRTVTLSNGETVVLFALAGEVVTERNWTEHSTSVSVSHRTRYDGTLDRADVDVRHTAQHQRLIHLRTKEGRYLSAQLNDPAFVCLPGDDIELVSVQHVPALTKQYLGNAIPRMPGSADPVAFIRNVTRGDELSRALDLIGPLGLTRKTAWQTKAGVGVGVLVMLLSLSLLPAWYEQLTGILLGLLLTGAASAFPLRQNIHLEFLAAVDAAKGLLGYGGR